MYKFYRYAVFTKSLFFHKTVDFFSIFPKNRVIFPGYPQNFESFFRKQPHFFALLPKITNFDFPENSRHLDPIFNHISTTDRFSLPGIRKTPPAAKSQNSRATVILVTISCYNSVIILYLYALFRNKKKHHSY